MKSVILITVLVLSLMTTNKTNEPPIFSNSLEDAVALSESSNKDILVLFSADWCGFCDKAKADINKNTDQLSNLIIVYVDIDKREDLKVEYSVGGIPDYMLLKKMVEAKRKVGYMKFSRLKDFIYK